MNRLRVRLSKLPALSVMDESIIGHDGVAEWDPMKLSVDVSALGISGCQPKEWFDSARRLDAADPELRTFRVVRKWASRSPTCSGRAGRYASRFS